MLRIILLVVLLMKKKPKPCSSYFFKGFFLMHLLQTHFAIEICSAGLITVTSIPQVEA